MARNVGTASIFQALQNLLSGAVVEESFYTEDVCDLRAEPGHIGVIERTTSDVDTHMPRPQDEYHDLSCHADIPKADYRKFKHDGIPPPGTVLVSWQTKKMTELIHTKHLTLVDRALLVGDVVKKNAKDAMSGVVTQTGTHCVICPSSFKEINLDATLIPAVLDQTLPFEVNASDLKYASDYKEGDLIIHRGWIGRIDEVFIEAALRLSNGNIVIADNVSEVENVHDDGDEHLEVGAIAETTKANLRRGRWIVGRYDANIRPMGDVVSVRPLRFHATWLWKHTMTQPGFDRAHEPASTMAVSFFEKEGGHIYDPSRSPKDAEGLARAHLPFISGDKVRFKDISGAALKYPKFNKIPLAETHGNDLNVFTIIVTKTTTKVLWQDRTEETLPGTSVVPDYNLEDENDTSPGEIVISNEADPVPGEDWIFQPKRVGVVQTVSPADRIAKVKWLANARVQYNQIGLDEHLDEHALLPGSTLGLTKDSNEDYVAEDATLYDIRTVGALSRRRGDFVVIHISYFSHVHDYRADEDIDWFGEVVDLNLDGNLTVRLGCAKVVTDVKVSPELTRLVHSSDDASLGDADDVYDDPSDSDGFDDEDGSGSGYYTLGSGSEDDGPWMVDGEPVAEDEGEEWATEGSEGGDGLDEDGDDEMPDLEEEVPQLILTQEATATVPVSSPGDEKPADTAMSDSLGLQLQKPSVKIHELEGAPLAFDVLETPPPANNNYLYPDPPPLSSPRMKRIRKEHAILQTSLPEGIFVRTWESRLDLLRVLIVGPLDTPYEYAPFVIDIRIPSDYPHSPPNAFFHSWTSGQGPVNPNLYENGKICLSLLGTWHAGEKGEAWSPARSTILQVLVSILGLVLVKEPYYNEAGFEARAGSEDAKIPSQLYSERTYFRSRAFITHALTHGVPAFDDLIEWLYFSRKEGAPQLLDKAIEGSKELMQAGEGGVDIRAGLSRMSRGALMMLDRQLKDLERLKAEKLEKTNGMNVE